MSWLRCRHTWTEIVRTVAPPVLAAEVERFRTELWPEQIERLLGGSVTILRECTQCREVEEFTLVGAPVNEALVPASGEGL